MNRLKNKLVRWLERHGRGSSLCGHINWTQLKFEICSVSLPYGLQIRSVVFCEVCCLANRRLTGMTEPASRFAFLPKTFLLIKCYNFVPSDAAACPYSSFNNVDVEIYIYIYRERERERAWNCMIWPSHRFRWICADSDRVGGYNEARSVVKFDVPRTVHIFL